MGEPTQQDIVDAVETDMERHRRLAWELAKGDPAREALYRETLGDPPE